MSDWIEDYINYTSSQESPEVFHRWSAVSTIAAVLNRRVYLPRISKVGIEFYTNYPGQLSICLVAGAGKCKKSTAVGVAKSFMKSAGVSLFDGKITPERLLNKLGSMPSGKPVLTVVASELSTFLSKASYNDGLIDNLIKLLDCESNPYETQKATVKLTDPCLTLLMATTPYNLGKAIPPQAHDTGFLSRHIFVYSETPGGIESLANNVDDIDITQAQQSDRLRESLNSRLRAYCSLSGSYKWSKGGLKWFNNYYNNYRNSSASEGEGYPQRRPDHLVRLAMCLNASRESYDMLLGEVDLDRADQMLDEVEVDMPKAFAHIGLAVNSDRYARIIKVFKEEADKKGNKRPMITGVELNNKCLRYFDKPGELMNCVAALIEAGVIGYMGRIPLPNGPKQYVLLKELD